MTASRIRPFAQRYCETIDVEHGPPDSLGRRPRYAATVGYLGGPIEIFVSVKKKVGSDVEAVVRDCAILASIALQYGAPLDELKRAVTRGDAGEPATVIGAVLDALCGGENAA